MNKDATRILAKLQTALAIHDAKVMANPKPYLEEAAKQIVDLKICLDDIQRALSPDVVFDFAKENDIRPMDIQGEALIRCNAAKLALQKYYDKPNGLVHKP